MLRKLPEAYKNVLNDLSLKPGAMLKEAYDAFCDEKPLPYEDPRNNKETLVQAVLDCMTAATFEIDSN